MDAVTVPDPEQYLVVDSPYEIARWRPLVNWLLFIPHAIIQSALQTLARVAFVVYWLAFLFTGRLYSGLYDVMALHERYSSRATGFLIGYSQAYPPFDFNLGPTDNLAYPDVRLTLPALPEAVPRSAALNVLKAIPHYVVLILFAVAAVVVAVVGWFAVLFTGAWPRGMRDFLVRVANYYYRVYTYVAMVDNSYPAFGLPAQPRRTPM